METRRESRSTMLWLTGWSMSDQVFDRLRALLPDFHHLSVDYSKANSPEDMLLMTETAAMHIMSTCHTKDDRGRLLICGWSLGGLLALRLAAKGYGDGLVVIAANARFTRSTEEKELGWSVAAIRQMMTELQKDPQRVETKFRQNCLTELEFEEGLGGELSLPGEWTIPGLLSGLYILRNVEIISELPTLICPVLIVHGTADKICPYGAARELADHLPYAELMTIPNRGHVPFLKRETDIADKMRSWWHEHEDNRYSSSV
ncbi:alpha/beta fold hydrolase [Paenibacillus sp. LMG 31461]|uniref:Alpha/beta fold hydrolase n=1 Tax=Paenibacillus plantarum TaxID=2654975 RepID=A0ABX1X907_9BACL|nr:alpha/beta fold hydrolase [Paenibacillus plantarum]NOU64508.1 alpha/beta fold hydrolase [Paenibacillus plantarum]